MKDLLLAIKRTPDGLVVVLSRRRNNFHEAFYADDLVQLVEMYEVVEEPLGIIQKKWPKLHKVFIRSWDKVSRARTWDSDLLFHVLTLLANTVPVFPESNLRLPTLELESDTPAPKKTAANPRGLRTTKGKKLKPKSLPEIDLRPYLCDPKNVSVILNKLKPYWKETIPRLHKEVSEFFPKETVPAFTLEPFLAFRHRGSGNVKRTELPLPFLNYLMFKLWDVPWKTVKSFLSLYHELGLGRDEPLLGAAARLVVLVKPDQALRWLQLTRDLPAGKRYSFLLMLLETHAYDLDLGRNPPEEIARLVKMIPYPFLERRLEQMLWSLNQGVSLPYLEGGFRLAKKYGWQRHLYLSRNCSHYPTTEVERFLQWLKPDELHLPFDIWQDFGNHEEWASIILRPEWKLSSPKTARTYIKLLRSWMTYQKNHNIDKRTWLGFLGPIDAALKSIHRDHHRDFLEHLQQMIWMWERKKEFDKYQQPACDLLVRLARKPFPYSTLQIHNPTSWFIEHLTAAQYRRFLDAPDSSFMKLIQACRTANKRRLINRGLFVLTCDLPEFSLDAFFHSPGKLTRVAQRLGTLKFSHRKKCVVRFSRHQLLKANLDQISPTQLYRLVEKYIQPGMTHPVPKKLQAHFNGETQLTEARIRGYHEKSISRFLSFALDVMDWTVENAMDHPPSPSIGNANWEHTVQFLSWVDANRRGFKRWFKAYLGGDNHYVENHPLTKRWFAKHKKINKALWNQGILFCRRTVKYGPVRIELENDPLEILKMGTYVGSCLSLGGGYAYSAVAVLLDLNKQVLYARDTNGKVLGRQLVAISQNDELVCFEVYPVNASAAIKNLFFEYDIDFAKALDIDLYEGVKDPDPLYTIDQILSQDWWDDYPWHKIVGD